MFLHFVLNLKNIVGFFFFKGLRELQRNEQKWDGASVQYYWISIQTTALCLQSYTV